MLAFRNAVRMTGREGGAPRTQVIEFDVQKSRDNILVRTMKGQWKQSGVTESSWMPLLKRSPRLWIAGCKLPFSFSSVAIAGVEATEGTETTKSHQ